MKTQSVKVSELAGAALDWAVAVAGLGIDNMPAINQWILWDDYHPTTNWMLAGPLRDKYKIDVMDFSGDDEPFISASYTNGHGHHSVEATTALIAICRAVVQSKLGSEIQIPVELLNVAN